MLRATSRPIPLAALTPAPAGALRAWGLAPWAALLLLAAGCTVTPRLDANFDADPTGTPPSAPAPTPPGDQLNWRTGFVAAGVVADPGGGRRVRAVPLPAFTASPDLRQVFLVAVTSRFTTNPPANIRGSVRLRLNNPATVGFALRPIQGEQTLDFIGGVELSNFLPPSGGGVHLIQGGFGGDRLTDPFGLPTAGQLSGYRSGDVVDINWTIDQSSRTFSATVPGQPTQSTTFPATSGPTATTPVQRLAVYVWLQRPGTDTVLFVDRLRAEEYR